MRNPIGFSGLAMLAMLVAASAASAQTVIQPQYEPGGGSGQSFLYQPGPTASANGGAGMALPTSRQTMQGPITGFGEGGLVHAPGTTPNPPYFNGSPGVGRR